ncbi:SPOR domain-containing protein [Roseococcus thiosulfatophilus]|uniref:SPOR domain-containing protein n=1 Tax=Roseococcus thiosulfatophilus TaxID=35813 RepID=UPI001F5C4213|nr:SPOR domain-containing protein [Roseococcus thiosulfatophilus]
MVWLLGGGLIGVSALGALFLWGSNALSPGGVPLIEADDRPFRVRPENFVAAPAPRPSETIFERPGARQERMGEARLAPGPERPVPEGWRQAVVPPPTPLPPVAPGGSGLQPAITPPPVAAPAPAPTPAPRPVAGGVQVQLGALPSEEGAMAEWNRLRGRVPELGPFSPNVVRFDREGRPTFWRLRVSGLPDRDAAQALCERVRASGGNCAVLGS